MEIIYSKEDLKKIIKSYYYEKYERCVEVSIDSKIGCTGLYESKCCNTTINISENVKVLGVIASVNETLSKEDLTSVMSELLAGSGYILDSLQYDEGIRTDGYCMNEYQVAYFNELKLNVSKSKKLVL